MKSMHEQLADLKASRETKAARMAELFETKGDRSFNEGERAEFDGLKNEIADIDDAIALKNVQLAQVASATPVDTKANGSRAPYVFARNVKDAEPAFKGEEGLKKLMCQFEASLLGKQGNYFKASELAERRYGKTNPTLVAIMKANEVAGAGSGSGEALAELVSVDNRYNGDFIEFLYGRTLFDKLPLRSVPHNVSVKGLDGAYTGYWVGESKPIPMSQGSASSTSTSPLKVAGLTVLSNELIRDSSPAALAIAGDALREAIAQVVDTKFFSTDAASAAVSPAGILNGLAAGTSDGGDAESIRTDVKALLASFITAKNTEGLAWVMTPTTAVSLSLMQNALGQAEFPGVTPMGGTFCGYPVYVGNNVGTSDVILMKPSEVWKIGDLGVQFSVSTEAMIEQSSVPTGETDTPTAASQAFTSMFQEESTAIKVVRPINFGKRRSSAVAYIGDALWGSTAS